MNRTAAATSRSRMPGEAQLDPYPVARPGQVERLTQRNGAQVHDLMLAVHVEREQAMMLFVEPFDLRALRNFLRIAELGSLSKAARTLHIAQPALSQQLAGLEDHLGVRLFERSRAGVTGTRRALAM